MAKYSYITVLICLILHIPCGYAATIYKCEGEGEGGSTLFSETPCKSQKGQKLYYQDNYPVGEGLSELELLELREIEEKERQLELERKQAVQQNPQIQKTLANEINKQECETADLAVKEWQKIMALGYPGDAGKYYQDELRKRAALRYQSCGN